MLTSLGKLPSYFNRDLQISPEFPRGFSFHLQPTFLLGSPPQKPQSLGIPHGICEILHAGLVIMIGPNINGWHSKSAARRVQSTTYPLVRLYVVSTWIGDSFDVLPQCRFMKSICEFRKSTMLGLSGSVVTLPTKHLSVSVDSICWRFSYGSSFWFFAWTYLFS